MVLENKISELEEVMTTLGSVQFDSVNSLRLSKRESSLRRLLYVGNSFFDEQNPVAEILPDLVYLSLTAIERCSYTKEERLYSFIADYFEYPCNISVNRVKKVLNKGIHLFPSNSKIPLCLGRAYYNRAIAGVRTGNTEDVSENLKQVKYFFEIASQRVSGRTVNIVRDILDIVYEQLPKRG